LFNETRANKYQFGCVDYSKVPFNHTCTNVSFTNLNNFASSVPTSHFGNGSNSRTWTIIGVVFGIAFLLIVIMAIVIFFAKRKRAASAYSYTRVPSDKVEVREVPETVVQS